MTISFKDFCRGLSEFIALIILFGLAITLAMSFLMYMQSNYNIQQNFMAIQRVIEYEKLNTVVRLIDYSSGLATILFRKLDGGDRVAFFIFNGSGYSNCSTMIRDVIGGRLAYVKTHKVEDIVVMSGGSTYSFKYYAKAVRYPDRGSVAVCVLEIDRNAVAIIQPTQELNPIAEGYNMVTVSSNNRRWRLYGSVEFKVKYLGNPSGVHLAVNGTWHQLEVGDIVRVDVDTAVGKIDLTPQQLPIEELGAWVLAFNVFAKSVYVNNVLLAKNVNVEIKSDVAIDIDSLKSSLTIEILPEPPGFVRITYGDTTLIDYWNNSDYIKIVDWKIDDSTQMVLQLDSNNLYAQGIARAVYVGFTLEQLQLNTLSIFVITYLNDVPYLVDVYEYEFSQT